MTLITRPAAVQDIPGIQALASAVLHQQHPPETAERMLARLYFTESLERALANNGVALLVALDGARIAGYCKYGSPLFDDCLDRKEIHALLAEAGSETGRIADGLLAEAEARLAAEPLVQRLSVYVEPANEFWLTIYGERGYQHKPAEDTEGMWYLEKALK